MEEDVLEKAKIYAQQTDRILSKLMEEYLEAITNATDAKESKSIYNKKVKVIEENYAIPEWLKGIVRCIDYVTDRNKICKERY